MKLRSPTLVAAEVATRHDKADQSQQG